MISASLYAHPNQSQKTEGFLSQILTHDLTKQGRIRIFVSCFIRIKEPSIRKSEWLTHSKILGILQTEMTQSEPQFKKRV